MLPGKARDLSKSGPKRRTLYSSAVATICDICAFSIDPKGKCTCLLLVTCERFGGGQEGKQDYYCDTGIGYCETVNRSRAICFTYALPSRWPISLDPNLTLTSMPSKVDISPTYE